MQTYIGTKLIRAKPMSRKAYNDLRGWTVPADENPDDEGFLVEYLDGGKANVEGFDGYVSWSPLDVFLRAYYPTTQMSFGDAVVALKKGHKVARHGWNGKGMFVYYVCADSYKAKTVAAQMQFGEYVPYRAYIAMKTVDNDVVPWVASQTDILAEDWSIV